MLKVLKIFWEGKQTISNPDAFRAKIKRMLKAERLAAVANGDIKRAASSSSLGSSIMDKSQKTGLSENASS